MTHGRGDCAKADANLKAKRTRKGTARRGLAEKDGAHLFVGEGFDAGKLMAAEKLERCASTGGRASLECVVGPKLPGVDAPANNQMIPILLCYSSACHATP